MDICHLCMDDLPWLGNSCRHCGIRLAPDDSPCCGGCLAANSARRPDRTIAALAYEFPVDRLITALKYRRRLGNARLLGELLAVRLREEQCVESRSLPQVVVPVPLHPLRLLQRSFNQATEIARWVTTTLNLRLHPELLRRVVNTPRQTGLTRKERLRNVQAAFEVTTDLSGQRIAVLDDVMTSGATSRELVAVLRRAGAAEVQVWTVARTSD